MSTFSQEIITTFSAMITFLIAYIQHKTNQQNFKKELFEQRCNFYEEIKCIYHSLDEKERNVPYCQIEDISHLIPKAKWLFGEDMCNALLELNCKEVNYIDQCLGVLPDNLERVFEKYMKLERHYNLWTFIYAVLIFIVPLNKLKK